MVVKTRKKVKSSKHEQYGQACHGGNVTMKISERTSNL